MSAPYFVLTSFLFFLCYGGLYRLDYQREEEKGRRNERYTATRKRRKKAGSMKEGTGFGWCSENASNQHRKVSIQQKELWKYVSCS